MNTKQFQYVLTLANESSFSKAADILNISQPSLSQYIKKIEREVGITLFDRTKGDVRITDAGKIYIETARKILDLEHQMEISLSDIAENHAGSLIIGATPYRAASMLPVITASFRKLYPGMHLIIREGTTAELAETMEHGEFDLALTLLPIDKRLFNYEKIAEEELVLAVPASFPALQANRIPNRKYPAVDAAVLNHKRLVMLTDTQYMQKQLHNIIRDGKLTVAPAAVVKSLEAQIEMVKAGVGMALMPSGIERFCKINEVIFYSFTESLPRREVVVMWRKDRKLSQIADQLKRVIGSIAW